jgi:hypothetical protein
MTTIHSLLSALDERVIAQRVAIKHDEARMQYHLPSNTVADYDEFSNITADYYNYHYTRCVTNGGRLESSQACKAVRKHLENEYRRRHGDIASAFNDAHDGTNGGLRAILDIICEAIKAESVEGYIQYVFDSSVKPVSWHQKVDIIRQFIAYCSPYLSSSIVASEPERYAFNYNELIGSYTEGLRQTSAMFRRF